MSDSTASHSATSEDRVRREAYRLWEEAGHPHGRDAEFWQRACAIIEREQATPAATVTPAPKARKKAAKPAAPATPARRRPRKTGTQPTTPSA